MGATAPRLIVENNGGSEPLSVLPSTPLQLSPEDRLDLLRYLDEFRFWRSIDDERRCARCHEIISGRRILVFERQGTRGSLRLQCPTPGCASGPGDWIYANPVQVATQKDQLRPPPPDKGEIAGHRVHNGHSLMKTRQHASARQARRFRIRGSISSARKTLARLPILRPLVSGLHGIRPVA